MTTPRLLFPSLAVALAAAFAAQAAAAASACSAASGPRAPAVVELYTSEGCSSCPPADRWLSALQDKPDVVALAFHVDYWDGLGWKDRFAKAEYSKRQTDSQRTTGARFAYTPQVVVDGKDTPGWSALSPAALAAHAGTAAAPVALQLEQSAGALQLTVTPQAGAPARVSGYVAVVDDGMQSHVRGGENRGATLKQDGVVRELLPWSAAGGASSRLRFASSSTPEPGAMRHWVAVATDADSGRPLQAVTLACH
jgi:hypothetical protein